MPIVLYATTLSPGCRAVMLTAKSIGVDMELREVHLLKDQHKSQHMLKMNPTHTVPTMDDNGFHIWESRAIMAYLVERYGKDDALYPEDPVKRALVDNMLYFDATCLFASAAHYIHTTVIFKKDKDTTVDPALKEKVLEHLGFFEAILSGHSYAAADRLTIADLSLICSITTVEMCQLSLDDFPNVKKWTAKIKTEVPYVVEITEKAAGMLKAMLAGMEKK